MSSSELKVAFVGVGRMGGAMLQCVLERGYDVTLYDPSEQATAPFLAKFPDRAHVAASARRAAENADVIEVVVNTNEQLLAACLGDDGVFAGAKPNSIVLVHSTVLHDTLKRLAPAAAARKVHLLDAMVSGARGQLSIPNLAVMCGGEQAAFTRAEPVMKTYGSLVLRLGELGAGLDAKLAINMLRYVVMAAGQEATRFAEQTGVGDAMAQLVAHTEANRYVGNLARLKVMQALPLEQRTKDAELAQKDLRAAIARASEVSLELPTAQLGLTLMHRVFGAES